MAHPWPHHHGILTIGGIPADRIAARYDTPCYVTDADRIRARYESLAAAFAPFAPVSFAYAAKANSALGILAWLQHLGACLDAVSPGEVWLARRAGFAPERITCTGLNFRGDELAELAQQRIAVNCDSRAMLEQWLAIPGSPRQVGLRLNPDVADGHHEHVKTGMAESKFGIHPAELPALADLLQHHGCQLTRLHAHIGSGIMDAAPYLALIDALHACASALHGHPAVAIDTIDLGGGLGIPYRPSVPALDVAAWGNTVGQHFRQKFPTAHLVLEPGRFLVADSTVLFTRVTAVKETPHARFLGVEAGQHTLLRPALYGAYHHIVAATRMDATADTAYTVCGPICESGDHFGQHTLPAMRTGDLLAICDTGAYGFAMASTYNSRPRPPEVLVLQGTDHLMRAREHFDDLARHQTIPPL